MDRLTLLILGAITVAPCACTSSTVAEPAVISVGQHLARWQKHVSVASCRFAVPESWIYAVMDAESNGQTMLDGRPITSDAGAMGLMQVMPAAWQDMRHEHDLGANPHDPRDNILAGTAYLRAMYDHFGFPDLFAAYHAGPGRYEEHLRHGKPLPEETISYLKGIKAAGLSAADLDEFEDKPHPSKAPEIPSGQSLFFLRNGVPEVRSDGGILVPLGSERTDAKRPDRR